MRSTLQINLKSEKDYWGLDRGVYKYNGFVIIGGN
jgi:hypothetical protein